MDPIAPHITEPHRPLESALRQQVHGTADNAEPGVSVHLSSDAVDALNAPAPVEDSEDTGVTEDGLHQDTEAEEEARSKPRNLIDLTPRELELLRQLKARDAEVRSHEAAHITASGGMAGMASFAYKTGPDGRRYVVSGEVSLTVRRGSTPEESLKIAEKMHAAALAPSSPSGVDRSVAAAAAMQITEAKEMISRMRAEEVREVLEEEIDLSPMQDDEIDLSAMQDTDLMDEPSSGLDAGALDRGIDPPTSANEAIQTFLLSSIDSE